MRRSRIFSMVTAGAAVFFACANLGGIGHEGEAKISGRLMLPDGVPAAQTQVMLFPDDYDPIKETRPVSIETTDAEGNYLFPGVAKGSYSILAINGNRRIRTLIPGIRAIGSAVTVPAKSLQEAGAIKIILPSGVNGATGYAYIPGTALFTFFNNRTDVVVIDSVPAGVAPDVAYSAIHDPMTHKIRYGVPVPSNDTVIVRNPSWKYAGSIILNTSATGADVVSTVKDFPVLIRLDSLNFDFSEVQPDGADLRFAKGDSTFLPYEIEQWDPAGKQAEIWVKVDTIRGNDSAQSITMYWGNPDASAGSNGPAVFDTGAGFQGVWHLDESTGSVHDATRNGYNGSRNGNQKRTPSEIGYGQNYDGSGDYAEMGNVCNPDTSGFTVCAWIKPSSLKSYRAIMSKSPGDSPSPSYGWLVELGPDGALSVFIATGSGTWGDARTFVLASRSYILDTVAWHHIAVVIDRSGNNKCKLYIDGSAVTGTSIGGDITGIGPIVNSAPMRLGSDAKGGCPWNGALDECSIAFTARSPDWVKLCYINQKTDGNLIYFINKQEQKTLFKGASR